MTILQQWQFHQIQGGYANAIMPHFDMYVTSSDMDAHGVQGGYKNLLLGVDQAAAFIVRKLQFDGVSNDDSCYFGFYLVICNMKRNRLSASQYYF